MQKLTDYVADFLAEQGLTHVFMLTGGGAMHLNHSLGKHNQLKKVYVHHEQAAAMAAESYARLTRQLPIVNVTTGPGGINTLNGVFGAWVDSIPMLIISGQVKTETTTYHTTLPLRQLGDQECRIIEMVKGITKYAMMVTDPLSIQMHLQKAIHLARTGRPGPVWIDIPMNVQGALIDTTKLTTYSSIDDYPVPVDEEKCHAQINALLNKISEAKRPVIMTGAGVRIAGVHDVFLQLIDTLKIPVTTNWNAHDVLHDSHSYHCGKPGTIGDRAGNFTVQNADLLIILGSRLNIRQVSYNWQSFAPHAYKIMIDVDPAELAKPTLNIDFPIEADLADYLPRMLNLARAREWPEKTEWVNWCRERKQKYPVVLPEYWDSRQVNPYCFMHKLGQALPEGQITVTGDGTACVVAFQAVEVKLKQRLYTNSGCASMGYDLPGAIGACVGANAQPIVCLAGDGSIMQNIQELATIAFNRYPIKIFVLNNNGYHSIRQTQQNFFGDELIGVGPDSGLGFPQFDKIAQAFGLDYTKCANHTELDAAIMQTLNHPGPIICEVILDLTQQFAPKLSSRRLEDGTMVTSPLEDMAPFLSREELAQNMIVTCDEIAI